MSPNPPPTLDIQGTPVPAIGYGTWELEGEACLAGVATALEVGYRHIDTAQLYNNEEHVGEALESSDVPRAEVFLTTKIWNDNLTPDQIRPSFEESLAKLRTDYVDNLLVHWPVKPDLLEANLAVFSALLAEGTTRRIGVSNFSPKRLALALEIVPLFNLQVENQPYLAQTELLGMCVENNMLFTAYAPLARGKVLTDPVITGIAGARQATPSQVVLRWLLDQGPVAVIPKAARRDHAEENLAAADVVLTPEDRAAIAALDVQERVYDPPFGNWDT